MKGKICMVTGATSGIGAVTARVLAERGATVIVVGRNPERCAATVHAIKEKTGNPHLEALLADLSAQRDIRELAKKFCDSYPRLDVLVNNAGAMLFQRRESVDGIEMTFALNHLGYFMLTALLLDRLKAGAPARIVNISSNAHLHVTLDFDDLQNRENYRGFRVYSQSKLANLLFTYELARRLEGTGVTVNALHPGVVATNIGSHNGWWGRLVRLFFKVAGMSPEKGARTAIYLASSPEVEGVSGKYFVKEKPVPSSPASYDKAAARRLWQVSMELVGGAGESGHPLPSLYNGT